MKPATAARKLGIYLPATPDEFQQSPISRADLDLLRADPPPWLANLGHLDLLLAVWEWRSFPTPWLVMTPKSA